MFVGNLGLFVD